METIRQAIVAEELPVVGEQLLLDLMEGKSKFISQEGTYWDFKREWPFSYSDEYFAGIARLICAFANSYGGIIVFGVHDTERTPGHNKVAPNMDRLQQALANILSECPKIKCRSYGDKPAAITILLVCPRNPDSLPIRFAKSLGDSRREPFGSGKITKLLLRSPST